MSDKKLHQLLTQVHEHLQKKSDLDEQSQALLKQVLDDVKLASTSKDDQHQDLSDRIEQQAIDFEEAHPTLSEILRQIMDTLGRIGV